MPTQYTSQVVKQNGPQYLKDNVVTAYVCIAPLKTDTVAQIQAKAIAQVAFSGADVSFVGTNVGDTDLQIILNAKSGIDPSGIADDGGDGDGGLGDDIATVYCSATENLLCIDNVDRNITDEAGDTIDIQQGSYTIPELVAA